MVKDLEDPSGLTYKAIYIDVSQAIIDSYPFVELLSSGHNIIIASVDRDKVQRALEILFLGLERSGNKRILEGWDEQVFWSVGPSPQNENLIRYNIDKSVDFHIHGETLKGWILKTSPDRPHIISIPHDEDIKSPNVPGYRFISCPQGTNLPSFVRSWFLEELLEVSPSYGGISKVLQTLREEGWGYAAEDSNWEFFLRHRHFDEYQTLELGPKKLDDDIWNIVSWSQFRQRAATYEGQLKGPMGKLSDHFHVLTILIFSTLCQHVADMDRSEIAILVSSSTGLPRKFSIPMRGTDQVFTRRWGMIIERQWSDLVLEYQNEYS